MSIVYFGVNFCLAFRRIEWKDSVQALKHDRAPLYCS